MRFHRAAVVSASSHRVDLVRATRAAPCVYAANSLSSDAEDAPVEPPFREVVILITSLSSLCAVSRELAQPCAFLLERREIVATDGDERRARARRRQVRAHVNAGRRYEWVERSSLRCLTSAPAAFS